MIIDDLRFAWRGLRNAPGFAAVAIATLALAIGANTAIFSIADAVLFRRLPYTDPDRVFILRMLDRESGRRFTLIGPEYLRVIDEYHHGLSTVGMLDDDSFLRVATADGVEAVGRVVVSPSYFQVLGIRPARGRLFDARDLTQPGRAAVLAYRAWQQRFGGDEGIVGRPATLGGATFDIVGVLPKHFVFPSSFAGTPEIVTAAEPAWRVGSGGAFNPIVRLEAGVTREQAQAEIEALVAPLAAGNPDAGKAIPVLDDVRSVLYPAGRPIMRFLFAAAGLVLLLGCANLSNMLLARSRGRERDIAVRAALGASSARLAGPLVFEAIIIGFAGAVLALLVTWATFDALVRQVPRLAYGDAPIGVDLRVAALALALGILGGLAFAVVPAWRLTRLDVQAQINGRMHRARGAWRLGRPMVAVQVALAIVLVFGAVIASRAFLAVLRAPLGFTPEGVVTVRVFPPGDAKGSARQAFYLRVMDALRNREDVASVGAAGSLPLSNHAPDDGVRIAGARTSAGIVHVLPGYFDTVGIHVTRGRLPNIQDIGSATNVAVVADSTARLLFPGRDPLGATFHNGRGRQFTVIGVVSDVSYHLSERDWPLPAYVIPEDATRALTIVVRTTTRRPSLVVDLRRQVGQFAPGDVVAVDWWADSISAIGEFRNPRFQTLVLGSFAALALGLTAIGVFGVVAFLVASRMRELGIRLAIGADPRAIVRLVLGQALTPVVAGLAIGLAATPGLARLAEQQLFDVQTRDPLTLTAAALIVLAAACVAAYLPARRASRADPTVVLRAE
jgi:putative ABC transport system permease protein